MKGRLAISTLSSYVQPAAGEADEFVILEAEQQVFEQFEEFSFNGVDLDTEEFRLTSDGSIFRDHIMNGQFITVSHLPSTVVVENYQATPGDVDGDRQVLFEDFLVMAANFGLESDWTGGDFTGDGMVLFQDFLELSANFGDTLPAASVPEPSAASLVLVGFLAALGRRRRRKI